MDRQNLRVETLRDGHQGPLRRQARHRCRVPRAAAGHTFGQGRRGHPLRRGDQHAPAAPALRRRRSRAPRSPSAYPWCTTCRASARTSRTTSRSTSSTPRSCRSRSSPAWRGDRRPGIGYQWLFHAPRPRRHQPLRGRRVLPRRNEDVDWPNLMFHFLPIAIRYDGSRPPAGPLGPRLPGAHRPDVRRHPGVGPDRDARDPRQHPKMLFNYLSTPNDRREWVEAIRVARDILNQPAFAPFNGGELSPGPSRRDRRGDPRLGPQGRRDGAAPLVHGEDGRRRACR